MTLSEQIKNKEVSSNIAVDCVALMEEQVSAKKGIKGVTFKTLYKGIKTISPDYTTNAIKGLLPSISQAIDPLWSEGIEQGNPVDYLSKNQSLTADTILTVTDNRIKNSSNKIVKASYNKVRNSLKSEIEEVVPQLAVILDRNIAST